MAFQLAEVEFHSEKNNFIFLHSGHLNGIVDSVPANLTVIFEDGFVYVSGYVEKAVLKSSKKFYIKINGLFASQLKLTPGDQICWNVLDNVQKCTEIIVEPLTYDDWEIIESNASRIEEQLLFQLRLAYQSLVFPMWIDNSICVYLKVESVKPNQNCVELVDGSVVLVAPKLSPRLKSSDNGVSQSKRQLKSLQIPVAETILKKSEDITEPRKKDSFQDFPRVIQHSPISSSSREISSPKKKEQSPSREISSPKKKEQSPSRSSIWSRLREAFSPTVEEKSKDSLHKSPKINKAEISSFPMINEVENTVFQPLIDDLTNYFELNCINSNLRGHVVVEGQTLSGTTFFAELSRRKLSSVFGTYSKIFDCKTLCGKNVISVTKSLCQIVDDCVRHEPSLVVLDDLDQLCSNGSAIKQLTPGADVHFARLSKVLTQILDRLWADKRKVLILATCKSRQKLHDCLVTVRGKRYFTKFLQIPILSVKNREILLSTLFSDRNVQLSPNSLHKLVKSTEGCVAGDLHRLVDRAARASNLRGENISNIQEIDVDHALVDFKPINLHNAQVNKESLDHSWLDVGGLNEAKRNIVRILEWPSKYTFIFASLRVRLARGILLYGPTGTGKTLLASVVAKECGLNFILIKGAELLSKYIGASEQAVRDTFVRARSAKPALILFDEFEALAPRRGHDSTGVTDRVVNQLLTELDGVEALDGVFVLATTSRPDLIDPAFLRPGRIDKCLFCGMPSLDEREEILRCLMRHYNTSDDVDLRDLAHRTYGFSGADLKALLFNAQLAAVHSNLKRNGVTHRRKNADASKLTVTSYFPQIGRRSTKITAEEKFDIERKLFAFSNSDENKFNEELKETDADEKKGVWVRYEDIDKALNETKPSVSQSELNRLQNIYTKFTTSSKSHLPDIGLSSLDVGQRATLA